MVLRCSREQLVKKYEGKLYHSRNSLVTEQAAKAGCRGTSTGDIQGRDESPICQGWLRCHQTCHNVQQWPGWCTRGLFSPKWACDLSFVPYSVCGTVCVSVCTQFLMFLCTSAARMSPSLYCQLPWMLSLLPICFALVFPLHFYIYFFFADQVFRCDLLSLFVFISHIFLCAFVLMYWCLYVCNTCPSPCSLCSPPPLCPAVRAADREGQAGGRFFLSVIRTAENHQVWVWKP